MLSQPLVSFSSDSSNSVYGQSPARTPYLPKVIKCLKSITNTTGIGPQLITRWLPMFSGSTSLNLGNLQREDMTSQ